MTNALTLRGITRTFPGGLHVLNQLDMDVPAGGIFVILGHSGCGKSTLLRIIGGFDKADYGTVLLGRELVTEPRPDMIMMFQSYDQLFPWQTLRGNLVFALQQSGVERDPQKAHACADEYLKKTGLSGFENAYPHTLSGGMKQRGALARALGLAPGVLLMDEPFSSLDFLTRRAMQSLLMQLQREAGITIVLVTHDIEEALRIGDTITALDKTTGRLVACEKDAAKLEAFLTQQSS